MNFKFPFPTLPKKSEELTTRCDYLTFKLLKWEIKEGKGGKHHWQMHFITPETFSLSPM